MTSAKTTARVVGFLWLLASAAAGFSLLYVRPKLIPAGEAAATVDSIRAFESLFRVGIASNILGQIIWLFLGVMLYQLFKGIDRALAMVCSAALLVGAGVGTVNSLNNIGALIVSTKPDYLKAFQPEQLNALALTFLRLNNAGIGLVELFTALFLFSLGLLIVRSEYLPRILGILLMVGACAFPINTFTKILIPQFYPVLMTQATMALNAFGAPATMLWLLIKGVNEPGPIAEV